ncbi:MAG: tRNA (adenosine(37)-N6)-threonylcarbamoyltransferase complex transferase subunit TsaD [Candidatus Wildermuthbacteria bacterium]|nr:tRNA (adenosine(37)-N6)-threonylcarbamoyltransferase complex transferase subunit TsaD [Candidatus Wildermuthbacteria bacterium]
MRILGIETSCDDTGIAVLEAGRGSHFQILSNVVASQIAVHQKYGGVYPMLAKREHLKNLPIVLRRALGSSPRSEVRAGRGSWWRTKRREPLPSDAKSYGITAIAVTYGPGLSPCLWAGLNFAQDLAKKWGVPLVPVDHIEGHLLIGLLKNIQDTKYQIPNTRGIFPAIALIVSGGHTQLVLVKDIGKYEMIGETRDDAAGECFDKTARILGLEYPGGPAIAEQARLWGEDMLLSGKLSEAVWHGPAKGGQTAESATPERPLGRERGDSRKQHSERHNIRLPRPMMHTKDYDFSFSGLKTAVLYNYQARPKKERESKKYIQIMAAEIQQAIVDVLVHKTIKAAKEYGAKTIIMGGGVAANDELRKQLGQKAKDMNAEFLAPSKNLSTDNGAMIALAGYFRYKAHDYPKNSGQIEANPNLRIA